MKRIRKRFGNLIVVFLFIVLATVAFYDRFAPPPLNAIPSQSMRPALDVGDLVLSVSVTPSELNKGDIIIVSVPDVVQQKYNYPSRIVHRIHNVIYDGGKKLFITKGDNNESKDPFVTSSDMIQGKVIKIYSYLGYIILFLNSTQGIVFLIASSIVYILYLLYEFYRNRRHLVRKKLTTILFGDIVQRTETLERKQQENTDHIIEVLHQARFETAAANERLDLSILIDEIENAVQLTEQLTTTQISKQEQLVKILQRLKINLTNSVGNKSQSDFDPIQEEATPKTILEPTVSNDLNSSITNQLEVENDKDTFSNSLKLPPRSEKHRKRK